MYERWPQPLMQYSQKKKNSKKNYPKTKSTGSIDKESIHFLNFISKLTCIGAQHKGSILLLEDAAFWMSDNTFHDWSHWSCPSELCPPSAGRAAENTSVHLTQSNAPSCDYSSCSTVSVMATKRPKLVEHHCLWNKFQCLFLWLKYTTYQCNSDVACKSHLFHHQWVHHPNISYQFCRWYWNQCNEQSQLMRGQGMLIQWPGVPLQDGRQSHPTKEQHVLLGTTKS